MDDYKEILKKIGHNFRVERIKKNLSQEKFAELANVHTNYIGKIERGEQNVTIKTLVQLANFLDVPVKKILNASYKYQKNNQP
ncbi:helix-turn-helix transcriptional regulator [bacterium]|nr:helix-turn-helix transcriptional regulator [bacterium]